MTNTLRIVPLTDEAGKMTEPDLLARCSGLHRQLRPMLPEHDLSYAAKMQRVCSFGARMVVALDVDGTPLGLALYRVYENTYEDLRLYIDDLVSDEQHRSQGIGSQLLEWCADEARRLGCSFQVLDSGTWRTEAHRLYFRQGFSITSFHFTKPLN